MTVSFKWALEFDYDGSRFDKTGKTMMLDVYLKDKKMSAEELKVAHDAFASALLEELDENFPFIQLKNDCPTYENGEASSVYIIHKQHLRVTEQRQEIMEVCQAFKKEYFATK